MALKRILVLTILFSQGLSAPSGCIESCTSYHTAYQSHTPGGLSQVLSPSDLNLHYVRPGNWTEHNQYRTNGGQGKVYEERGQYVDGQKKVRYYKKNYTSSYSTGNVDGAGFSGLGELNVDSRYGSHVSGGQQYSQNAYQQAVGSEVTKHAYNRVNSEQSRVDSQRLEDFGEYASNSHHVASDVGSHVSQDQHYSENRRPGNWTEVNSYRTDGGRGQVYEEEGQYVTGPKRVRFYKKNYTSSYSSTGVPVPIPSGVPSGIPSTVGIPHDVHKEIQNFHDEFNRQLHELSSTRHISNTARANSDLHAAEATEYAHQINYGQAPATGVVTHQQPYVAPSERREVYENQQTHVTRSQVTQPGLVRVPVYRINDYRGVQNSQTSQHETQQAELVNAHQTRLQNQNLRQEAYGQNIETYPSRTAGNVRHYEHHWSSGHTRETTVPGSASLQTAEQLSRAQYNRNHLNRASESAYSSTQGHNTYVGQSRENNYNSAYRTGSAVTGVLDLGQVSHGVDCDETAAQIQYGSPYHRQYKRDAKREMENLQQKTEDLTQQTEEFGQRKPERITQQRDQSDLSQVSTHDDLTQQTTGHLEFGQQTPRSRHFDMYDRRRGGFEGQTTGQIEFGRFGQSGHQRSEDLTQQSEDLTQQTGGFDDLGQQTTIDVGFGRYGQEPQGPGSHGRGRFGHPRFDDLMPGHRGYGHWRHRYPSNQYPQEDLTQQNEDLTQQTAGFDDFTQQTGHLEFGQQPQGPAGPFGRNPYPQDFTQQNEDLTQQTGKFDDFTQQTTGHLEFGQRPQKPQVPPVGNQQIEDLTQQNEDDLSQTTGHLEFGQQSQKPEIPPARNQQKEDSTQQKEDATQQTIGHFDFGSQRPVRPEKPSTGNQRVEDLTQQTTGHLEFGQHVQTPEVPSTGSQHVDDFSQQNEDDLRQQTTGHLEFGQKPQKPGKPSVTNQYPEDLTQQNEDFTQQNEDFTQQAGKFDDFTQQTMGHLEFGQHPQEPSKPSKPVTPPVQNQQVHDLTQQSEDLTQQTSKFDDFTQQTTGHLEFGQETQKFVTPEKPSVANQHLDNTQQAKDDLAQQTTGHLEFGQKPNKPEMPSTVHQEFDKYGQQSEDLTQQTNKFDDFTQQTTGHIEFGNQRQNPYEQSVGNQYPQDFSQQNADSMQQTNGFDDFMQQAGNLALSRPGFGRGPYTQRPSTNQYAEDSIQQNQDLTQQPGMFDDFTQQTSGAHEYGQTSYKPKYPSSDFNQQNQDLSQYPGKFGDFTQQTTGGLEFGGQKPYKPEIPPVGDLHKEDNTQSPFGRYPSWQVEQSNSDSPLNQKQTEADAMEQEEPENFGVIPLGPKPAPKPTPRPRYQSSKPTQFGAADGKENDVDASNQWKPQKFGQPTFESDKHTAKEQESSTVDIGDTPVEPVKSIDTNAHSDDENLEGRGDQSLPKDTQKPEVPLPVTSRPEIATPMTSRPEVSRPATKTGRRSGSRTHTWPQMQPGIWYQLPGTRWHYSHQPGDLTNSESQTSYYPSTNYGTQETTRQYGMYPQYQTNRNMLDQSGFTSQQAQQNTQVPIGSNTYSDYQYGYPQVPQSQSNVYHQGQGWYQTYSQNYQNQVHQSTESTQKQESQLEFGQKPQEQTAEQSQHEFKLEPRILEAYGGGPYDSNHGDDIYSRVPPNPSATLPPYTHDVDPWDIREKPRETPNYIATVSVQELPKTTEQPIEPIEVTEAPPSFWGRIGHKLSNTFDKAKEKARGIFG